MIPWTEFAKVYPWIDVDFEHRFAYGITAVLDPTTKRYVMVRAEVIRRLADGGLSAVDVREIPFTTLLAEALMDHGALVEDEYGTRTELRFPDVPDALERSDRVLWAARRYVVARAAGAAPLKNVADWLGVAQSTATRLISEARKQGVLDG